MARLVTVEEAWMAHVKLRAIKLELYEAKKESPPRCGTCVFSFLGEWVSARSYITQYSVLMFERAVLG